MGPNRRDDRDDVWGRQGGPSAGGRTHGRRLRGHARHRQLSQWGAGLRERAEVAPGGGQSAWGRRNGGGGGVIPSRRLHGPFGSRGVQSGAELSMMADFDATMYAVMYTLQVVGSAPPLHRCPAAPVQMKHPSHACLRLGSTLLPPTPTGGRSPRGILVLVGSGRAGPGDHGRVRCGTRACASGGARRRAARPGRGTRAHTSGARRRGIRRGWYPGDGRRHGRLSLPSPPDTGQPPTYVRGDRAWKSMSRACVPAPARPSRWSTSMS